MELITSNSEIQCFKKCRRSWYLEYVKGYRKQSELGPLALGDRVHQSLATYYSPGGTADSAILEYNRLCAESILKVSEYEIEKLEKEAELGLIIVSGYFDWLEDEGADEGLEFVDVEREMELVFNLVLNNTRHTIHLLAKRDAVGIDHRYAGRPFFVDHKTLSGVPPHLDLDEQVLTYSLMQKRLIPDQPVEYAIWNMLRKVKRTATAKPPFYYRLEMEISTVMLENFERKLHGVLRDIIRTKLDLESGIDHHDVCYTSPGNHCDWKCSFRQICPMLDDGSRAEQALDALFIKQAPYQRYNLMKDRITTEA